MGFKWSQAEPWAHGGIALCLLGQTELIRAGVTWWGGKAGVDLHSALIHPSSLSCLYTAKKSREVSNDFLIIQSLTLGEWNEIWNEPWLKTKQIGALYLTNKKKLLFFLSALYYYGINEKSDIDTLNNPATSFLSGAQMFAPGYKMQLSVRDCQDLTQKKKFEQPNCGTAQTSTLSLGSPHASFLLLGQNPHAL